MGNMKNVLTSADGDYCYSYYHAWDLSKPLVMFIGINPSSSKPEYTNNRLEELSKDLGFGGFYSCNLFAFITNDFMEITKLGKLGAVGKYNDKWLKRIAKRCDKIIFAWGINGKTYRRCDDIINLFKDAYTIGTSLGGYPPPVEHIKNNRKLIKYKQQ